MAQHMLTTVDNPFDPFTQFDEWLQYDIAAGYGTMEYLARVAKPPEEMSEKDQDLVLEAAIEEIVEENITGLYKKVSKSVENL